MNISTPQEVLDNKPPEADCLRVLSEIFERKAQMCGQGEIVVVHQQDGACTESNLTSKKHFAQLSNMPRTEVYRTETKDFSAMYQDEIKGESRLCV